jgi:UDP-N-acetylglucosamine--N-acetylmuramyl-(pentapeptide) pyrophosphoryl-undecaprenol N-acetylglucosamine transferase
MKILFTGGGTGGHFYPIIAIAQALYDSAKKSKVLPPKLYFMAPSQYNPRALFDNDIEFVQVPAGKIRRYFSLLNFTDLFKTLYGVFIAIIRMYQIYPDVVFGKGGYASFPPLLAARILRIPVIIHESDSSPGKVNSWAGKFAQKIAVSYPEASKFFKKEKVAFTGNPIRKDVMEPLTNGAREYLKLDDNIPTIFVIGGSQGAQNINDVIIEGLAELVEKYQIIHQTGRKNFDIVTKTAEIVLKDSRYSHRYHPYDYLNDLSLRMAAGASDIVVSRAGSAIFEIASWGLPSIIIPLPQNISHDQVNNAFSYAHSGACVVMEEQNLSSHILISEIDRIINNQAIKDKMSQAARQFSHIDAAQKIANVILETALSHE